MATHRAYHRPLVLPQRWAPKGAPSRAHTGNSQLALVWAGETQSNGQPVDFGTTLLTTANSWSLCVNLSLIPTHMKNCFLALFLLGVSTARAQAPAPVLPAPVLAGAPDRYCVLLVEDRYFESPSRLQLDYGQAAPGAAQDPEMAEIATKIGGSRFIIDGLNYLSQHGWELLNVTTVPCTSTNSNSSRRVIDSETRYLLRRRSS